MIPEANLGSDLQAKIPDRVTGLAASITVVGSAHRAVVKLRTGSAYISIEDRMEGMMGSVVAEHTMINGCVPHRALSDKTLRVEMKEVPSNYFFRQPAAVHRRHECNAFFFYPRR